MHLAYALRALLSKATLIIIAAALGLSIGVLLLSNSQTYSTSSFLIFTPSEEQRSVRAVDPSRFVKTEADRILGDDVMARAAGLLGTGLTPGELRDSITVSGGADKDDLEVIATARTAQESLVRSRAFLGAISDPQQSPTQTSHLWTNEPSPNLSPASVYLGGGLLGGGGAALMVLLWAAVRRPIMGAAYIAGTFNNARVVDIAWNKDQSTCRPSARELLSWTTAQLREPETCTVLLDVVGDSRAVTELAAELLEVDMCKVVVRPFKEILQVGEPNIRKGRIALLLAQNGTITEQYVELRLKYMEPISEKTVIGIIHPSRR